MARKKPIISPLGQWAYPGEVTIIPSSDITMKGVNYPVLGIDDLGNQQMMMPGQDYTFPGDYVTEIPQMGKGGLAQWFDEKWVDVKTGKTCGRSGKDKNSRPYPACRPSKRVNETTPKTSSELSSAEKARFKREKTSGKRIDYNHKRREEGGEIGWLDEFQVGGRRRPIYTSDLNDPRLRSYNDSLYNYNLTRKYPQEGRDFYKEERVNSTHIRPRLAGTVIYPNNIRGQMKPIRWDNYVTGFGYDERIPEYSVARFKKPVQPYVYKKPEVVPEVVETPLPVAPIEQPVKKIGYNKPIIQQFNYMSNENKAKALQKYGSVSDIPFQGVDINQLKNGGWLDEFQVGGVRRPIYTSNPNDPRLQRFNDSLSLYEQSKYLRNLSQNSASNTNVLVDGDKVFTPYKNWKPFVYDPIDLRKRNALTRAAILSYQADELRDYNNLANSINKRHSTIKPESILTLVSSSRFPNGQRFTESLGAIYKRPVAPIYYKKPTALPKVYKKPEVVPEVVETPVAPAPVIEPPKPSLFVSNIDRDMYTPGGGMAREYNIGVTLQDGNRRSFRTEKEFQDWKAANNLDISKAKVTEGRGYSYDYPENKKYGGWLDQFQTGGWDNWTPNVGKPYMRTSPAGNAGYSDNARVVTPFTGMDDATRARLDAQKAEEARRKRSGVISQGTPETSYQKAKRKSSFVEQEKERTGSAGPMSYVLDVVNPVNYVTNAIDLVGNTGSAVVNASQGNFAEAGVDLLGAGLNALDVVPLTRGLGLGKIAKPAIKKVAQPFLKYADDVVQTSKIAGKPALPTYKNVYRGEHANFNTMAKPDDFTGRWALDNPKDVKFYVGNLKTPRGDSYTTSNYFKGEVEPVRIMRDRLPEYKMKQQFAEGMPEEARIMSMGRGKLTDKELASVLGDGAADRIRKGILTEMDYNSMSTAPFMYNTAEGILDANRINQLRKGENTFLGRGKTNLFPDQKQAIDYLSNQSKGQKNSSLISKYLPFSTYKNGGWLNKYQPGGEVPSDIERMQGAEIFKKRSWLDKLRGYVHKGEKAIGLDPYNERSDDFMEQWARRINTATGGKDWYKQPNDASGAGGIGTAIMETVMAPFSAPQLASVYGATGKVQMPSEAMNIQNPVGSFLADAILDPTNLVGAGIAKNLGKGSLQNMIRNRSRGVRPDFTPNVSNQLAPPPSEIIVDPTTGQFNSYFNQDMERPYFDEWVRMMNNNASELDVSNLFANPAESIDLRKLKKIAKNRSGLTKEEILKNASPKDKEVLSKMSESEFEQTVLKPTGEVVPYEPAVNLGLGFNTNTRNLNLSDVIPMDNSEYVDIFNSRLDRLNEIISKNNKSGLDYSVKGLSPSGALTFNTPAQIEKLAPDTAVLNQLRNRGFMDEAGNIDPRFQDYADRWGITGNRNIPQGESTWMLDINPGQWRGEVEDIANAEYFKAIPGLNMRNTTASVFSDALPRRGTGTYNSINEYLKELDLGRVKPGFNSQSQSSSGLWEDAIKKGKAFGYFNNPGTVYGSMRTVAPLVAGAAAASQLPEQKNGGWLNNYQDGGENLPELNSKIDIANFYKNPLSEKYGIYQDPTDKGYKYYSKSQGQQSLDLSTIDNQRLKETNIKKGFLPETKEINIKPTSPILLPETRNQILRDRLYNEQNSLMEEITDEIPIIPPSYKEVLQSIPKVEDIKAPVKKYNTLPNKQKPAKAELNKNIELNPVQKFYADRMYEKYGKVILTDKANNRTIYGTKKSDGNWDLNSFEVLTGQNPNFNDISNLSVEQLGKNRSKRGTPIGLFSLERDNDIYGYPGLRLNNTGNIAYHITYKGPDDLYRSALYNNNNNVDNYRSYGCINCEKPSLEALLKFAKPEDKALIINSNLGFKNNENWIKKNSPDLYNDLFKKQGGQTDWLKKYK